jgi:hypothetical protein
MMRPKDSGAKKGRVEPGVSKPCMRQHHLLVTAGDRHGVPDRVLARHSEPLGAVVLVEGVVSHFSLAPPALPERMLSYSVCAAVAANRMQNTATRKRKWLNIRTFPLRCQIRSTRLSLS